MNTDKKQQARHLYAQTDLNKTQIAAMLGITRRTVSSWVHDGDWDRLKLSARHLPAILAENIYHIIGHLTQYYLSERRLTNPVSFKEADTLHKLACTIGKLKNRSSLNESMEMMGFFMNGLQQKNQRLSEELSPYIEEYLASRANIHTADIMPESFSGSCGRIPWETDEQIKEKQDERSIDMREAFFADPETIRLYNECSIPLPSEDEVSSLPEGHHAPPAPPYGNKERQEEYDKYSARKAQEDIDRHNAILGYNTATPAPLIAETETPQTDCTTHHLTATCIPLPSVAPSAAQAFPIPHIRRHIKNIFEKERGSKEEKNQLHHTPDSLIINEEHIYHHT